MSRTASCSRSTPSRLDALPSPTRFSSPSELGRSASTCRARAARAKRGRGRSSGRAEHGRRQTSGRAERAHRRELGRSAAAGRARSPTPMARLAGSDDPKLRRHWRKQPAALDGAALLRFGWRRKQSGGACEESIGNNQFGLRLVDLGKSAANRMGADRFRWQQIDLSSRFGWQSW
ncbi:hypothetical protein PVAP13_8NG023700 [Panicum virgatum]|uniref:Uncharacterized protein n=1 Tax=Panicum virgatum TaxID=38727 RepID=A0A8T0P8X3_PANVG|nr:hypothetical protein PVAP13_8NG023700 [Panicum virgatum]